MRLMEADIIVGVDPHTTRVGTAVNQDHPLVAGEIPTCDEQRIQAGDSRSYNASIALFGQCTLLSAIEIIWSLQQKMINEVFLIISV